ncbi:IS481 family transposase [Geothrix sp. PMB-07]|uniref:IS481 family transposase n=1 Tax=Geothrix sp. PMB-07 TaxID=3068640 RepID=UPI0027405CF9|nr:IS481 family transposase [Geothrix sp. PMB-07]WLT32396.1 IS481 family transposase [Geothrix sp. PMB-07]
MNLHSSAKTCPFSRGVLVRRVRRLGWTVKQAAQAAGISVRTAYKWLARFRKEGRSGLMDRSCRPLRVPSRTEAAVVAKVIDLRRSRLPATEVARMLGMPRSTVGLILRRKGLSRWSALEKKEPPRRYEIAEPVGLLHLDIKKLERIQGVGHRIHGDRRTRQRGIGWEHLHIAINAHSRSSYDEVLPDEKKETTASFLQRALLHFQARGVTARKLLTDNGSPYRSKAFKAMPEAFGLTHSRTRPYRPRTNGKAERFIQTALREWAYRLAYQSSEQRSQALKAWLHHHNHHRPHSALGGLPPAHKLNRLFGRDRCRCQRG